MGKSILLSFSFVSSSLLAFTSPCCLSQVSCSGTKGRAVRAVFYSFSFSSLAWGGVKVKVKALHFHYLSQFCICCKARSFYETSPWRSIQTSQLSNKIVCCEQRPLKLHCTS